MKLKELAAVILALATLTSSVTALVKTFRADTDRDTNLQNTALSVGETNEELEALRECVKAMQEGKKCTSF